VAFAALTVSVAEVGPFTVREVGLKEQVIAEGAVQVSATGLLNPLTGVKFSVSVVEFPLATASIGESATIEKSLSGLLIDNVVDDG
jgi:hypothetical protein